MQSMECFLIWMRLQFRSSIHGYGFRTELYITPLGQSPSVGSFSPALTDMEVFHISSLLVGNQFHDVVVDISFFDIIFFFFFLWTFSGFIHRFLSWKIFLPLSRISYAVYLIHVNFVITYGAHSRKPFYVSELSLIITSLGILVIAFILASVATVAVEMPFLNLDKLFFTNHSKTSESK